MPYEMDRRRIAADPGIPLWRYLSLGKFLSMLSSSSLWFAPVALLDVLDPFEGVTPPKVRERVIAQLAAPFAGNGQAGAAELSAGDLLVREMTPFTNIANCWRSSQIESAVMWRAYAPSEGVVIKSTIGRLEAALADERRAVFIGAIEYIDHPSDDSAAINDYKAPAFRKRREFLEEREVRALIDRGDLFHNPEAEEKRVWIPKQKPGGERVPVILDTLIEEIRLAPGSEDWQVAGVERVLQLFGLAVAVRVSEITDKSLAPRWPGDIV